MTNYSIIAQVIVALSIVLVWIFRFGNIVKEFKQYGLSDVTRSIVGSAKIALSTLLVAGIWYLVFGIRIWYLFQHYLLHFLCYQHNIFTLKRAIAGKSVYHLYCY